jgi:hypothetical protein
MVVAVPQLATMTSCPVPAHGRQWPQQSGRSPAGRDCGSRSAAGQFGHRGKPADGLFGQQHGGEGTLQHVFQLHAQRIAGHVGDDAVDTVFGHGIVQMQFQLRQVGMADGTMGIPSAERSASFHQRPFDPRVTGVYQ